MATMTVHRAASAPRLSVKDFARYFFASQTVRRSILRRHKFRSGEGFFMMTYYPDAVRAIRRYLASNWNPEVLDQAIGELSAKLMTAKKGGRTRLEYNIQAVRQYQRLYGRRKFKLVKGPKLRIASGRVVISASPDLHVEENGEQLLIKFDFCRTPEDKKYVRVMLQVIRQAAEVAGLPVAPRQITVFDIGSRTEYVCPPRQVRRAVQRMCKDIDGRWDGISERA